MVQGEASALHCAEVDPCDFSKARNSDAQFIRVGTAFALSLINVKYIQYPINPLLRTEQFFLSRILSNPDATIAATDGATGSAAASTGNVLGAAPGAAAATSADDPVPVASETADVAKSVKCEDCGKLLKSALDAEAHAAKSGHANFAETTEEIKPLTEEEKKQKLEE